ncbi:flagellar biosynthesis protein flip [Helicobacter pylori]|nr:flagellar biosynthesis protein flip [Helicobacter pylori]
MRVPLPAANVITESIKILKLILGNFNMPYLII